MLPPVQQPEIDLSALRREYTQAGLSRRNLHANPFHQFEHWFQQACAARLPEPNAMVLATATAGAEPFVRTVLLKYFDSDGLVFFTNYESRKARQIEENPQVAVLFPWLILERQVQIAGRAVKIATAESLRYFVSRPRGNQLGAWCSPQSAAVSSRRLLEMKFEEIKRKFADREVPLPSFWGGYRIVPHSFEFWQGRPNRLHDRFWYSRREDGSWDLQRLAP